MGTYRLVGAGLALVLLGLLTGPATSARWTASAPPRCQTFAETGKMVCGKFLAYWQAQGDLPRLGYPISDEFSEVSTLDQRTYTVQYFERAVLEWHPENAGTPYEVLAAQLGTYQYRHRYPTGDRTDRWAALAGRLLRLPSVSPGSACPTTPGRTVAPALGPALGTGPIYPVGLGTTGSAYYGNGRVEGGWAYYKVLWVAEPAYQGSVLIRGGRLDGPEELRFADGPNPLPDLRLDTAAVGNTTGGWANWPSYTRLHSPGCYAYQVDGPDFTTLIFFQAVNAPGP